MTVLSVSGEGGDVTLRKSTRVFPVNSITCSHHESFFISGINRSAPYKFGYRRKIPRENGYMGKDCLEIYLGSYRSYTHINLSHLADTNTIEL